jgi:lathosterol oxidase
MEHPFIKAWLVASKYIVMRYFIIAGLAYLMFYVILKNHWSKKKIQKHFPSTKSKWLEIMHSLVTMIIFASMAAIVFKVALPQTQMYFDVDTWGIPYLIISFPLMFLVHDTYFYWIHRFMHLPWIFKHVHLVHHKSTNPTPWTSYSFHVVESILEALILPIIAFSFPVHRGALVLFLLLQFLYNVYGHLGFELYPKGFHRTWIGKWINTSVAHNMHHKYFRGNYGLYFLFWDRWMGTLDEQYDQFSDERRLP